MRVLATILLAGCCYATPVMDLFFDASITVPSTDQALFLERHVSFDRSYLIRVTGGTGEAVLGFAIDLQGTGTPGGFDSLEMFGSYASVQSPIQLSTPLASGQGSGDNWCYSPLDPCNVPFTFGEQFLLSVSGFASSSYIYAASPLGGPQRYAGLEIVTQAHIWMTGAVYDLDQGFDPLEGVTIEVIPIPEPSTIALSTMGSLLALGHLARRRGSGA